MYNFSTAMSAKILIQLIIFTINIVLSSFSYKNLNEQVEGESIQL